MSTTTDLKEFGFRELKMGADLLKAYCENKPEFLSDEVHLMMNKHSSNVFLTDSDFNVAMFNGDELDAWLFTPYDGHEGFMDDLTAQFSPDDMHEDDVEFLRHWAEILNFELPEIWQKKEGN